MASPLDPLMPLRYYHLWAVENSDYQACMHAETLCVQDEVVARRFAVMALEDLLHRNQKEQPAEDWAPLQYLLERLRLGGLLNHTCLDLWEARTPTFSLVANKSRVFWFVGQHQKRVPQTS